MRVSTIAIKFEWFYLVDKGFMLHPFFFDVSRQSQRHTIDKIYIEI